MSHSKLSHVTACNCRLMKESDQTKQMVTIPCRKLSFRYWCSINSGKPVSPESYVLILVFVNTGEDLVVIQALHWGRTTRQDK